VDYFADDGLALDDAAGAGLTLDEVGGDLVAVGPGATVVLDVLEHAAAEQLVEGPLDGGPGEAGLAGQPALSDPALAGVAVGVVGDYPEHRPAGSLDLAVL
jgi:hypothetical protein